MFKTFTAVINIEVMSNEDESDENFEERIDETLRYLSEHVDTFKVVDSYAW